MLNLITVSHTVTLSLFQTCQRGSTQSRRRTWSWNRRTKSSGSTSRTSCLPPASFRPPTLRANGSEVRVPGRPLGGGTRHRDMERALFSHQTWVPVTRTAHSPQSKLNIQWSKKTKLTFSTRFRRWLRIKWIWWSFDPGLFGSSSLSRPQNQIVDMKWWWDICTLSFFLMRSVNVVSVK